ncbi:MULTISPECIES: GNAT family N-acetyltransferase [Streptomyces]|uniref:GNAT family N-acetyltransferase n=1 Tax=Streptomyces solicathayae TaxID=3081768 RepID=A0ABZ0M3A9_9ACTN|nr:GNAT family N-acetyltransferase [Streptomyces sp. HUAS YS2]WOX26261.1 GNAT family N-acetyltransferase [Streptomyces sp. HUAS YS2]
MPELQRLRADHAPALLAFEEENRAYFARSVPDRGDAYFAEFGAQHQARLDEQATGRIHFHVLVAEDGEVLGRVNLVDVEDGAAELGYRIAEKASGHGLATAAVRELAELARTAYGLALLRAETTLDNPGSRAVLSRVGFVPVADIVLDGRPGTSYTLALTEPPAPHAAA